MSLLSPAHAVKEKYIFSFPVCSEKVHGEPDPPPVLVTYGGGTRKATSLSTPGTKRAKRWKRIEEKKEERTAASHKKRKWSMQVWWRGEEREEIANCQMDRNLTKTANTYSSLTLRKYLNAGEGVGLKDCFSSQARVSQTQHLQLIVKALSYMFFGTGPLCRS